MKVKIFRGYDYTKLIREINEWIERNQGRIEVLFIGQSESGETLTSNSSLTMTIWYIKARHT